MISAVCRLVLGVFVAILTVANFASAGEIEKTYGGVCDFTYGGAVESGDLDKIKASGIKFGNGLCLDSPGGVFIEGVTIAEWLVEAGVKTVIRPGAVCFSACAIVFMGGGYFEDAYFSQRELYFGGQLGFHAPYSVPSGKTYTAEQFAMAYHFGLESVAKMMSLGTINSDDIGFIPTSVILELLKMPPDKLYMVDTGARIRKLHIDYKGAPPVLWVNRNVMNACFSAMAWMEARRSLTRTPPGR